MLREMDGDSLVRMVQLVGGCLLLVVCVRLRPWRWLAPFFRGSRHG